MEEHPNAGGKSKGTGYRRGPRSIRKTLSRDGAKLQYVQELGEARVAERFVTRRKVCATQRPPIPTGDRVLSYGLPRISVLATERVRLEFEVSEYYDDDN